jgi:F-type H+-transporting ATPase subunit b
MPSPKPPNKDYIMEFFRHAESWVLVSFILFLALLVYLKVPAMLGKTLDERAGKISKELDDARKLREEAEALLKEYQQKRVDAEKEAANIVAQAKSDAIAYAAESKKKLDDALIRRTKQAEQKIAQAEAAAVKDVRSAAAELAVAAATSLIRENAKGKGGEKLIAESISAVRSRLN